jgi:hypothetical protein
MRCRFTLVAVAACYKAGSEPACGVSCASDRWCPGSLVCGDHNLCNDPRGSACSTDATTGDALVPLDAAIDAPKGCFGHFGVVVCPGDVTGTTGVAPPMIDTGNDNMCSFVRNGFCVIAGTTFTINDSVTITGTRPLVIYGSVDLTINAIATLDASSHIHGLTGPAANDPACTTLNLGGSDDGKDGGGGGAGGSFGTLGGSGGNGNGGNGVGANAGIPGTPVMATSVRGGCPGGTGGKSISSPGAPGGSGGGAIYLVSGGTIAVSGAIAASGAGGSAGPASMPGGGGGGGSGGLVVFDAPSVTFNAGSVVVANGGGGGGSSRTTTATDGADPTITFPQTAAVGGKGNPPNGQGGAGSTTASPGAGTDGPAIGIDTGGGGGGGGGGHIVVFSPSFTSNGTAVPGYELL